ncbi:phage holin family protein [Sphingomonas sp. Leaf339]|uniref:phage holin family protein n=1 Tax=Sphingomonas sp. Leaf339 TaxID=1736343 RepID=UPI000AD38846|nr:phage holin family protein [Sphingomonas sp. Leaf339]
MPPLIEEDGITTLIGRLVDDSRHVVSAEIGLYKAKVSERIAAYKSAVAFFAVAGVLALAALIALLVGLIMSLTPLVGPWLATGIVVVVVLAMAGSLAFIGKGKLAAPILPERSV